MNASKTNIFKNTKLLFYRLYEERPAFWTFTWLTVLFIFWIWNLIFLNAPALRRIEEAFINTFIIGLLVIFFASLFSWIYSMLNFYSPKVLKGFLYYPLNFLGNLIRSIPQILGILIGYIGITLILEQTSISGFMVVILIAVTISLFVFLELSDLMMERIDFFKKTDFVNAMRVCGISDFHIINYDILFKNSRIHIFNKLISLFGMTFFLLCSIDFIISVGLSTDVSAVNLPVTLGSMLAKIDSKQDILAIGTVFFNPAYLPEIFTRHLQGVSVAFLIVFTLLCVHKISDAIGKKFSLN